jgi:hypothetical protein
VKDAARSVALFAVVAALCIGVGELVLRRTGIPPRGPEPSANDARFHPVLGWKAPAGETLISTEPGNRPAHFWPNGQRASWSVPDRPAVRTVLVLGCSFTAGTGVLDEETYVWRLNARYPDVRFENLAVSGYGTYQNVLQLERMLRNRKPPALVIYGFIGDHGRRNVATLAKIQRLRTSKALFLVPPHVTLSGDGLEEHRLAFIQPWPLETRSAWAASAHELWLKLRFRHRGDQKIEATHRLMLRLEEAARRRSTQQWIALLNNIPEETPPFLREHGITAIDCVNPDYETDPIWKVGGVGHPSALQHERWTECLGRALEARGIANQERS